MEKTGFRTGVLHGAKYVWGMITTQHRLEVLVLKKVLLFDSQGRNNGLPSLVGSVIGQIQPLRSVLELVVLPCSHKHHSILSPNSPIPIDRLSEAHCLSQVLLNPAAKTTS